MEYSDRQDLEREVQDYGKQIETLGESQKEYQEDIEKKQQALRMLKSQKGVYTNSDNKMIAAVETAIKTRETDVEKCKEEIRDVQNQIQGKLENLQKLTLKQEQRIENMSNVVDSLNHKNDTIVNDINSEIQTQKDDLEDVKEKSGSLRKIREICAALATFIQLAAIDIGQIVENLQSIGLFK